jgi:transposase-like protein
VFDDTNSLKNHIMHSHKEIHISEYYIKYISVNDEHLCKVCKSPTPYKSFKDGFYKTCSNKCRGLNTETKNKIKQTNLERYGSEYGFQNEDVKQKIKNTNLKKYGYEQSAKNEKVKNKILNTRIERYGSVNLFDNKEINEKRNKTNLEKYGALTPFESNEIREKIKNTVQEKYGVDNVSKIKEIRNKAENTMVKRYGHKHYISSAAGKVKLKEVFYIKLLNSKRLLSKVTPVFSLDEYNGISRDNRYEFKCNTCNHIFLDNLADGHIPRCFNCYPHQGMSGTSKGEHEVYEFVKSILPENTIIIENDRSLINPLEIDIYIPDYKLAIEFNGLYWHSEKQGKDEHYHINKTNLCKEKGIDLIHIFDDEWFNKQDIVCSIIANKLKIYENTYNTSDLNIHKVPFKDAELFLDQNHIQGYTHRGFNYGLYDSNNNLISMITVIRSKDNYEILRFCTKLNTNVVGGFQKLVNDFSKDIKCDIITYSDLRYGYGNIYESSGFELTHTGSPNYFYTNDYMNRDSRLKFQKHKLNNLLESFDPTLTEWQNMQSNEYDRVWDCGNNVFKKKVA